MKDAPLWQSDMKIEQVPEFSYDYYRLQLAEDSLVTWTIEAPSKGKILLDLLEDDGSNHGRSFAFVRADAKQQGKTIHTLQLRVGTYYVRADGPDGQPYNASYTLSPLQSLVDVEPNNSAQQANALPLNTLIKSVGSVGGFDDYYTFTLTETSKVQLRAARFMPHLQVSQLQINVDDAAGNRYLAALMNPLQDGKDTEVLHAGTYTVHVSSNELSNHPAYELIIETEPIAQPATYKNSIFGTALKPNEEVRGFLGRNDDYYLSLEREQKVQFTVATSSSQRMGAQLYAIGADGQREQLNDYTWTEQDGVFTLTARLQPGQYVFVPTTTEQQDEVHYTVRYNEVKYSDVASTYRYYEEIMALSTTGIIQGYPDGTFKPTTAITRRQVFKMLARMDLELEQVREMIMFSDIIRFSPDYLLIQPFYEARIIDGSAGNMNLNAPLTRAQLAKILVNAFELQMKGAAKPFADISATHFAKSYIEILASNGITTGSNGRFMPNEPVSREHFAVFLYRLFQLNS